MSKQMTDITLIGDAIEFEIDERLFRAEPEKEYPRLFKWSISERVGNDWWEYSSAKSLRAFKRYIESERHYSIASLDL